MKRALHILGEPRDAVAAAPEVLRIGSRVVRIEDAHDGTRARQLAEQMVHAGAERSASDEADRADFRIAVRATPESNEARLRAEVLEETADLILGSARPAFARRFVEALHSG